MHFHFSDATKGVLWETARWGAQRLGVILGILFVGGILALFD